MRKYKVEVRREALYVVDVLAEDEKAAKEGAKKVWGDVLENGLEHYYQISNTKSEIGTIYDVTGTDDPFASMDYDKSDKIMEDVRADMEAEEREREASRSAT